MPFFSASFEAIGVCNQVTVTDRVQLARVEAIARAELAALDAAASRFRDDSEIAALGAASGRPLQVSPLLFEAIEVALRVAAATDGTVDPTVGAALNALGYDRDYDVIVRRGA